MGCSMNLRLFGGDAIFVEALGVALAQNPSITIDGTTRTLLSKVDLVVIVVSRAGTDITPLVRQARLAAPEGQVVVLAQDFQDHEVVELIEQGVRAFVSTAQPLSDLLMTLEAVHNHQSSCSPRVTSLVFGRIASLAKEETGLVATSSLTDREREVLHLIGVSMSNKEIAQRLNISVSTVKNHVHRVLEKLRLRRRRDAVAGREHFQLLSPRPRKTCHSRW